MMTEVFIADTKKDVSKAVNEIFSNLMRSGPIIKSSKEVYIKVNGIDFKKHAYTSPEVLKEVIKYLPRNTIRYYLYYALSSRIQWFRSCAWATRLVPEPGFEPG